MQITNALGYTKTFGFGKTYGRPSSFSVILASGATATISDDPTVVAQALHYQQLGLLTIPAGPVTMLQNAPSPGYTIIDILDVIGGSYQGDSTLVTLGTSIFELQHSAAAAAGHTKVANLTDATTVAANLKAAINADAVLVAHGVTATDTIVVSATDVRLVVLLPATLESSRYIATSSTGFVTVTKANTAIIDVLDVTGSTYQGDAAVVTLGTSVFELEHAGAAASGNTLVVTGASATTAAAAFKAAINADATLTALGVTATDTAVVSATDVRLTVLLPAATVPADFVVTSGTIGSLTTPNAFVPVHKVGVVTPPALQMQVFSFIAGGATSIIPTGFGTIASVVPTVRTAAGLVRATVTVGVTWVGGTIALQAGSTPIGITDVVTLVVVGHA